MHNFAAQVPCCIADWNLVRTSAPLMSHITRCISRVTTARTSINKVETHQRLSCTFRMVHNHFPAYLRLVQYRKWYAVAT